MRVARKIRQAKSNSASKSARSSALATAESSETSQTSRSQSGWTGWVMPQGINRVPTHAVTVPNERRAYVRANLCLQARILRIAGRRESQREPFVTVDVSSSGLRARCPFEIEVGTPVNLEVELVRRETGSGTVKLISEAHVVRVEPEKKSGWHTLAFNFDDITFERDDLMPPSFSGH
jgi:hypothetical protein